MKRFLLILAFCFGLNAAHSDEYEAERNRLSVEDWRLLMGVGQEGAAPAAQAMELEEAEMVAQPQVAEGAVPITVVTNDKRVFLMPDYRPFPTLLNMVEDLDEFDRLQIEVPLDLDSATFSVIWDLYFNPGFFLPWGREWEATGTTLKRVLKGLNYLDAKDFLKKVYIALLNNPINIESPVIYYHPIRAQEIFQAIGINFEINEMADLPLIQITQEDIPKIKNCKKRKGTISYLMQHNPAAIKIIDEGQTLSISQQQIKALFRDDFNSIKVNKQLITTINLTNNDIGFIEQGTFKGLNKLRRLNLNLNKLQSLPVGVFEGLDNLRELHLSRNQLQSLSENVFLGLKKLTELSLYNNQFQSLPVGVFEGLKKLRWLILEHNQLQSLPENIFEGLNELIGLTLHRNKLQSLRPDVFEGLNELRSLYLGRNKLQSLPVGVFEGLVGLREGTVYLEGNPLLPGLKEQLRAKYPFIHF